MKLITSITPAVPPMLEGFASMHTAMRRDAERLPAAVAHADDRRAAALVRWFDRFRAAIEHHHQREDDLFWPALRARSSEFAIALAALTEDHHRLDRSLARTAAALAGLAVAASRGRAEAIDASVELAGILDSHLAREEEAAFERLSTCFTAEEYDAIERQVMKGASMAQLAFEAPWALDGLTTEKQHELLATAPLPLRLLYRWAFAPRYDRLVSSAFG